MAKGVINLQKESGGIVKISPVDGTGVTEVTVPESGNLVSVGTAVTDNAVVRFNGVTGEVQNSGVIIDGSNNVGVGITPSAWSTNYKAITLHNYGSLYNGSGNYGMLMNGTYDAGNSFRYSLSDYASMYKQLSGTHQWFTAPSGTAGSTINWNTAMTLGSNGNLLVGTTTDNGVDKLQVEGSISASNVYNETSISVLIPAGATVTQEFSLPLIYTTYAVKATMDGNNMVLHAFANYHTANWAAVIVGISNKFIGDYNVGSIDLQTKNNLPQFTYGPEKGLKGQCVATNGDSVARNLVITIKKII